MMASGGITSAAPAETEDALIVRALLNEERGKFAKSRALYETLYQVTGKKEYLIQEAKDALMQKSGMQHSIDNLVQWVTLHPEEREASFYRILVALYIEKGALADAENVADTYLGEDASAEDRMAVAALKQELGKPDEAVKILQALYRGYEDERILLQLVSMVEEKTHGRETAIALLSQHIRKHKEASVGVYFKLIELYGKENNLAKVVALYKRLYQRDPQKYFLQKIIEISLYRKDIDGVISFLESQGGNEEIRFSFYKEKEAYTKAIQMAEQLFQKSRKVKWLAEEGMILYEKAKKESKVIDSGLFKKVQSLLEQALKGGLNDPLYLNYYGYTLIDHDLDVDRGILLVKKALKTEPENTYYLDSLAWGLYKKGKCAKAYTLMKKVVFKEGLEEEEIKTHWELIKRCTSHTSGR